LSEYYVCVLQTIVEENRVERERVRKKELIEHMGGEGGGNNNINIFLHHTFLSLSLIVTLYLWIVNYTNIM